MALQDKISQQLLIKWYGLKKLGSLAAHKLGTSYLHEASGTCWCIESFSELKCASPQDYHRVLRLSLCSLRPKSSFSGSIGKLLYMSSSEGQAGRCQPSEGQLV
jgi:hypothetical protein